MFLRNATAFTRITNMNTTNNDTIYTAETVHQALAPSEIAGVFKLDRIIKVKEEDWKECLLEINKLCAMRWIVFNSNKQPVMSPEEARNKGIRLKFSAKYLCHRSGSYSSRASSEGRPVQKKSKKAGCSASLSIRCYYRAPEVFEFTPGNEGHSYHQPGDCDADLRCLSLSKRYVLKTQAQNRRTIQERMKRYVELEETLHGLNSDALQMANYMTDEECSALLKSVESTLAVMQELRDKYANNLHTADTQQ